MKVLIVGKKIAGSSSFLSFKAFQEISINVQILCSNGYSSESLINRIFNKFCDTPEYWGTKNFNEAIIKKTKEFMPDFILFFKPILISPSTITELKKYTKVFSWYPDYIPFHKTASVDFFNSIPLYDCHFSFNFANVEELKNKGAKLSFFLPCAADPDYHKPVGVSDQERKELGADVVFVGTYAKEKRSEYLERLCQDGYNIKIYGDGWENHPKSSCLWQKNYIQSKSFYGEGMSKVLDASKITLAFVREHNKETLACRTYEIPAAGGFMLHQRTAKTGEALEEDKEGVFFSTYEEMKEKIDLYLKNENLRKEIIKNGRERVLKEDLFIHRVQRIIEVFNGLK